MTEDLAEARYRPINDDGFIQCVWCGTTFGDEGNHSVNEELNMTHGPVVRTDTGTKLDAVIEVEPETPLVHPVCWMSIETVREAIEIGRRANENTNLSDFA